MEDLTKNKIKKIINEYVTPKVQAEFNGKIKYETFGKDVEEPFLNQLVERLQSEGLIKAHKIAPDKNHFPDLEITDKDGKKWAIDVKSANHFNFTKKTGQWKKKTGPANDLGSFPKLREVHNKYTAENVLFAFVHYVCNGDGSKILETELDNHYAFFGENRDNLIKYRKGDGKIRPRNFGQKPFYTTADEMLAKFERSEQHWLYNLALKAVNGLDENHRKKLKEAL